MYIGIYDMHLDILWEINLLMLKKILICYFVCWYFIFYNYFFVRIGFGVYNFVLDTRILLETCNGSDKYDYCSDFFISYVSSITLFIVDIILAIMWLCFIKIAVTVVRTAGEMEKTLSTVKLDNVDIQRRITERNSRIMALQGQLADRGELVMATEQLENALTEHKDEDNDRSCLLPRNK